mgnify:CR=1 FL=1
MIVFLSFLSRCHLEIHPSCPPWLNTFVISGTGGDRTEQRTWFVKKKSTHSLERTRWMVSKTKERSTVKDRKDGGRRWTELLAGDLKGREWAQWYLQMLLIHFFNQLTLTTHRRPLSLSAYHQEPVSQQLRSTMCLSYWYIKSELHRAPMKFLIGFSVIMLTISLRWSPPFLIVCLDSILFHLCGN